MADDDPPPTGDRATLGWALLFSVPIGVGVSVAAMRSTGRPPFAPIVAVPGVLSLVAVFVLVAVAARGGSPDAVYGPDDADTDPTDADAAPDRGKA
jgi:hypothetical protein